MIPSMPNPVSAVAFEQHDTKQGSFLASRPYVPSTAMTSLHLRAVAQVGMGTTPGGVITVDSKDTKNQGCRSFEFIELRFSKIVF